MGGRPPLTHRGQKPPPPPHTAHSEMSWLKASRDTHEPNERGHRHSLSTQFPGFSSQMGFCWRNFLLGSCSGFKNRDFGVSNTKVFVFRSLVRGSEALKFFRLGGLKPRSKLTAASSAVGTNPEVPPPRVRPRGRDQWGRDQWGHAPEEKPGSHTPP